MTKWRKTKKHIKNKILPRMIGSIAVLNMQGEYIREIVVGAKIRPTKGARFDLTLQTAPLDEIGRYANLFYGRLSK